MEKRRKKEKRKKRKRKLKLVKKLVKKDQLRNFACGTHLNIATGKRIQQKRFGHLFNVSFPNSDMFWVLDGKNNNRNTPANQLCLLKKAKTNKRAIKKIAKPTVNADLT